MTPVTCMAGRSLALFGLGGSGLATALALKAGGAHVLACDDNPSRMEAANAQGIETIVVGSGRSGRSKSGAS